MLEDLEESNRELIDEIRFKRGPNAVKDGEIVYPQLKAVKENPGKVWAKPYLGINFNIRL